MKHVNNPLSHLDSEFWVIFNQKWPKRCDVLDFSIENSLFVTEASNVVHLDIRPWALTPNMNLLFK